MENTRMVNASQPVLRMNLNDDPLLVKEGETTFALNAVVGKSFYKNAKGNQINAALPSGFLFLGDAVVDSKRKVVLSVNPTTGEGQVGLLSHGKYEIKSSSNKYNFRIDKQIQAKAKINYKGEIIVYFTDNYNGMRRLNLSNIPVLNGDLDADSISVYQNYSIPDIRIKEVINNGALLSGSYYIIAQYADANGNGLTSWFTPIGPVPIIKDSISDSFDFIEGILSNQVTDKAIKISFANSDLSYQYMNVGFIKQAEGVKRSFKVATIPVGQQEYTFTGTGNVPIELTLEEVTKPVISYKTAKTVEIADDVLIWGNLKGKKTYNLQSYFNKLQVQWQVEKQLATDNQTNYVNPTSTVYRRVFRFGEAYAIGIVLVYKDGSKSQVFVIPGREANKTSAGLPITLPTDQYGIAVPIGQWDTYSGYTGRDVIDTLPRWKQFNTAYILGTDLPLGSKIGIAEYGELGFYESSERYPLDARVWGTNSGQQIRLHQMPDQSVISLQDGLNGERKEEDSVYLNYLGIRFPNVEEVIASLPEDIKKDIQGWEIVVGDRTFNKSVIASGLMYNTWFTNWRYEEKQDDDIRLYKNFPFNDLRPDNYYGKAGMNNEFATGVQDSTGFIFQDRYKKDIFDFLSPDTSFNKAFINKGELHVHAEMYGTSKQYFKYVDPFPMLKDKGDDNDEVAIMGYGAGWYNNYKKVGYGNVRRKIDESLYVPFNVQTSTNNIGIPMQNLMSNSTVLFKVNTEIDNPSVVDTSKSIPGGDVGCEIQPNLPIFRTVSSYYASMIRRIDNQYGDVFNVKYNTTNYNNYNVADNTIVFAGDTFIGRFTSKRQHVFFQNEKTFMNAPDGADGIDLKTSETIHGTRYFYLAQRNNTRRDSAKMCDSGSRGHVALIYSGIPVFYAECDDNLCYRLNGTTEAETFYKNLNNGSLSLADYLGIKFIDKDNYYAVNKDLSVPNDLSYYDPGNPSYDPDISEGLEFYGRSIYSLSSAPEDIFDNWQIYLPLNYYDFPKNEGPINDIRYIGNYRTLFRLENGIFLDQLYTNIQTDQSSINLGNGKLFEKKPQKLVTSDNQYSGTKSQWCFNNTPYGAFMADSERGVVFNMSEGLRELNNDAENPTYCGDWFQENLPFKLSKQIPSFTNTDNPANPEGIGLLSVWDAENKIWILTKKDYELVKPEQAGRYEQKEGVLCYEGVPVSLSDVSHFANCSFSVGYSILNRGWCSFYSFTPNYYMAIGNVFYSAIDSNLYSHDSLYNHIYYNKRCSFIIETVIKNNNLTTFYNLWYSFTTKAFKELSKGRFAEQKYITFNKAIIYNSLQCSGLLKLVIKDENDLSSLFVNGSTDTMREIELKRTDAEFNFSNIYNIANSINGQDGFFTKDWSLLQKEYYIDKVLDNSLLDYDRGYQEEEGIGELFTRMRLILDDVNDVTLTTYMTSRTAKLSPS